MKGYGNFPLIKDTLEGEFKVVNEENNPIPTCEALYFPLRTSPPVLPTKKAFGTANARKTTKPIQRFFSSLCL
ncbi:MAG: hypothetical protein J7L86_05760 [Candidatus Marinimicrobia bacterium]|nr:hypothetical protein [Candidatus Neomarinimicrobiota bacterium]